MCAQCPPLASIHVFLHTCACPVLTPTHAATHTHEKCVHCLSLSLKTKIIKEEKKNQNSTNIKRRWYEPVDILEPINHAWMRFAVSTIWSFAFGDHMGFRDHSTGIVLLLAVSFPSHVSRLSLSSAFWEQPFVLSLWFLGSEIAVSFLFDLSSSCPTAPKITTKSPDVTVHIQAAAVLAETPLSHSDPWRFPCFAGLT